MTYAKHDNPPAFPTDVRIQHGSDYDGMSLCDYFAAKALNALLSNDEAPPRELTTIEEIARHYARLSYIYADAMLAERAKGCGA